MSSVATDDPASGSVTITGGYGTEAYARALHHIGEPVWLPGAATWILRRAVPGGGHDLAGPYPLLRCADWDALAADLADQDGDLTFCAVTDALRPPSVEVITDRFFGCSRPWKLHHIVDLAHGAPVPSAHHRRNLRRARVQVAEVPTSVGAVHLVELYGVLAARHDIRGDADFPSSSLTAQANAPGARTWIAVPDGAADDEASPAVAVVVGYRDGAHGWYHLGAANADGYRTGAMYALFDRMFADLAADGVRTLDLGAGAGSDGASAGLERFKRGWATRTLPTHLIGATLDAERCRVAVGRSGGPTPGWFPPYRGGPR